MNRNLIRDERPRICVIDDDEAVLHSLRILLESHDLRVETFCSASDFLDGAESRDADCLVIDLHMPHVTGLELLERLRANGAQVPAILMTARPENFLKPRISRANVLAFLIKPIGQNELLSWIDRALDRQ